MWAWRRALRALIDARRGTLAPGAFNALAERVVAGFVFDRLWLR